VVDARHLPLTLKIFGIKKGKKKITFEDKEDTVPTLSSNDLNYFKKWHHLYFSTQNQTQSKKVKLSLCLTN
jgi:hypothetical protein